MVCRFVAVTSRNAEDAVLVPAANHALCLFVNNGCLQVTKPLLLEYPFLLLNMASGSGTIQVVILSGCEHKTKIRCAG